MRKYISIFLIVSFIGITGCIEEKDKFTINPDGSGKVIYESHMQPMSFEMMGEKPALQVQLQKTATVLLLDL
jgi:hypothetical protein